MEQEEEDDDDEREAATPVVRVKHLMMTDNSDERITSDVSHPLESGDIFKKFQTMKHSTVHFSLWVLPGQG